MTDWADELTDKLLQDAPQDKPFRQIMAEAIRAERSRCAGEIDNLPEQTIRLHCGELTVQEMRFTKAVLHWVSMVVKDGRE